MEMCLQYQNKRQTDKLIADLKKMSTIHSEDSVFTYKLSHTYDIEPSRTVVQTTIIPEAIDVLTAYIMYKAAEFDDHFDMENEELAKILVKFYGAFNGIESDDCQIDENFDLYLAWEKYCGRVDDIYSIELFHRDGLDEYLEELVLKEETH